MILSLLPSILLLAAGPPQARPSGPSVKVVSGPVRMARVSYVEGTIDWRPDSRGEWSEATVNLPLREGAQIWAPGKHRAEIQFDDGSLLRLSDGAVVTLKEMYSDQDGEFTVIKLTDGAVALTTRNAHSIYQIDTPCDSVKTEGISKLQVRAEMKTNTTDVACHDGRAQVFSPKGTNTLQPRQRAIYRPDGSSRPQVIAPPNNWDKFNDQRDERMGRPERFAPSNVGIVSGDLDQYGDWDADPEYSHVWYPRGRSASWRPYQQGNWMWVEPVGWTWVSEEPWGWAPYHYGSWIRRSRGWGWVPGPVGQPWSPAVVNFTSDNGYVAWAPLAPREVRYGPALNVGFRSGNWSLFFSIGGVASYYPAGPSWCEPSYYDPYVLRRRVDIYRTVDMYRTWRPGGRDFGRWRFMPTNGVRYAGGSLVALNSFGRPGRFRALDPRTAVIFKRGRNLAPPAGRWGRSRALFARPTLVSMTPRGRFVKNVKISRVALTRNVFHAGNSRFGLARAAQVRNNVNAHRLHEARDAAKARRDFATGHGKPASGRAAKFIKGRSAKPNRGNAHKPSHPFNHGKANVGKAHKLNHGKPKVARKAAGHGTPAHRSAKGGASAHRAGKGGARGHAPQHRNAARPARQRGGVRGGHMAPRARPSGHQQRGGGAKHRNGHGG